jgi:hypothetical protein
LVPSERRNLPRRRYRAREEIRPDLHPTRWQLRAVQGAVAALRLRLGRSRGVHASRRLVSAAYPAVRINERDGILDVRSFSGKLYVIAEFNDGNIYHYYDAAHTDWDTIADGNCDVSTTADFLASKINNSTAS